jgi:two-component system, NtrC family, sensor histidine kinase HydH
MVPRASREMPTPPPPPGFEEIQRQELSGLFGRMVGARLVFLPVVMGLGVWAAFLEPGLWQRALLAALIVGLMAFFVVELVRFRSQGIGRNSIRVNLAAGVVGQVLVTLASGGLQSPFLFAMIPIAIISGIFIAPPLLVFLVGFQVSAVVGFALLEVSGAVPGLHLHAFGGAGWTGAHAWTVASIVAFVTAGGSGVGRAVRAVFDGMLRKALTAQQESLRLHGERAEELGALSAEIAHELKNPLASVKGLAGLLAPGVEGGKSAERLAVLRREVDRMQAILDEFLNFSRPLVPLALGRVDLAALSREVAALHEGMAQERGVALEVRGAGASRCDPRKVKQILVNLVQNALDASPAGAAVDVEVSDGSGGTTLVRVLDRGHGLDAALGEKVFEAGVTTKARGSGIGLTVARALARQHGGDLSLTARPGGGCTAELRLPAAGEATPVPGAAA